ncbi:MAG: tetratricopeptide repeat protein [Desulfobulbaceae bacterium]|nr:tetratricopeptide repeat protein [Desulfobulbaceae bacterium]
MSGSFAGEGIAPDRNISMVQGEPGSPEWKIYWDRARNFARNEDYFQAIKAYSDLIRIKPNIEEANWEYCKVLLLVEDYSTATKIIGGLLDKDPNNSDYLLAGGVVATHWKNYLSAIRYYGRVFEKDPTGINSDASLLGLATSLRNLGKKELAFSLLEQFSLRHPENSKIIHYLALDAHDLGKGTKSRKLYTSLLVDPDIDDRIIFQAVMAFDVPGFEKQSSKLWLMYLERHPNYMPFRQRLVKYSINNGNFEDAVEHLRYLADNNQINEDFLLEAAGVCERDLNRPDRALFFYDRYIQKHPENQEIKKKIFTLQTTLANDFLSIVENDGAMQLWSDLAEISLNRLVIFHEMADRLEQRGQVQELTEVLTIIYENSSHEDDIALRIAHQYHRLGEYNKALDYLSAVSDEKKKTKSYYLFKGATELQLGLEIGALTSFELGLSLDPIDLQLRTKCLKLAGKLGNTVKLKSLFNSGLQQVDEGVTFDFVLSYLDLLTYNFLFQEYEKVYYWAREHFAAGKGTITRLDTHRAFSLRKEGKTRHAEQFLRQFLNKQVPVDDILFLLAENAAVDKNIAAAESWYQALEKDTLQRDLSLSLDPAESRMVLLRVNILKAEGNYREAQALIDNYQSAFEKMQITKQVHPFLKILERQRCWLSFYNGKYLVADKQCRELLAKYSFDPELVVLREMLSRKLKSIDQVQGVDSLLYVAGNPILTRLLALAEKEIEYHEYDAAAKHLKIVLEKFPGSVAGRMNLSELAAVRGNGDRAAESLSHLLQQFPEEPYFHKKLIEVEARRGRYQRGLVLMRQEARGTEGLEPLEKQLSSANDVEEMLTLARLLWGNKQQEKSLQIYKKLLAPPVLELLTEKFQQKQINYHHLTRENSFWESMMLMLQSEPKVLSELMAPPFLIENRGNDAGKIVSELYEKYSWQKLISNEYMARKAIFNRNYYYAEQSYKRLLEDDSSEGMIDLATIYSKIGKYRKEAQVYEAMQNSGTSSPDLQESIERNTLQMSPQSIFNAVYEEKDGRGGNIDVARTSVGTSFWFTPDLDKDIRLIYTNNRFESVHTDQSTRSNFLYAVATYEFSKAYELVLGAGAEKLTDGKDDTDYNYEIELKGQLDDYVNGYVLFEKKSVYDTITAIQQQITYQAFETGLSIETPLGLSFGGDLHHRYYSDDNSQNRFHLFSSYSIFGESVELALRYEYQYLNNDDDNSSELKIPGFTSTDEPVYWSPSSYKEHRMTLKFKQDFLGYEQGTKKSMSYYEIDNGVGFEDHENLSFTTDLNIFLEMSPHFLLKGNFTFSKSDEYEEKGLSMSLHYRW